jgi:hypothetical protein
VRLQLQWSHQAQFVGYYVAEARGFYEREGIANHPNWEETVQDVLDSLRPIVESVAEIMAPHKHVQAI